MKTWTPAEIFTLLGIQPENLRRKRADGMLEGIGFLPLPGGNGWTQDPSDPRLSGGEKWRYRSGDVIALAFAKRLSELGVNYGDAMRLATSPALGVLASWIEPHRRDPFGHLETPFLAIWRNSIGQWEMIRLADPARAFIHAGTIAILIDCKSFAAEMPRSFVEDLKGDE